MRRKTLIIAGVMELVALSFAKWHEYLGLQTDEAKYLLNIPYPHPPLVRTLMSWTEWIPGQDFFWRLLLASILVQLFWLVREMGKDLKHREQIILCGAYFSSTAFLLQTGTVMLSPVFAMFGIVFLWLRTRTDIVKNYPGTVALLWLGCVFSTFQGALLFPLVYALLRRSGIQKFQACAITAMPLLLLSIYTLGSPLVLATILIHGEQGATGTIMERLRGSAMLWVTGGGGIGSVLGTVGLLKKRDLSLLATAALVLVYTTLSVPFPFYAILWLPVLLAGTHDVLRTREIGEHVPLLPALALSGIILALILRPKIADTLARDAMSLITKEISCTDETKCNVMISGSFGHQWQHASTFPVVRYVPDQTGNARAVVCLSACEPMFNTSGWKRLESTSVETWVRK